MLSKRTKYALNALVEMAREPDAGPMSAADIAERAAVPAKFLEGILSELNRAGIVASTRGRHGGHRLRRAPEEVNMAEVVRLFDGAIGMVPCVTYNYYERCEECKDEATCGLRDVFQMIRDESVNLLKQATLADVLAREKHLRKRLARKRKNSILKR